MTAPKRHRKPIQTTISDTTRETLDAMIAAGLYPDYAKMIDAAVAQLKRYHQRRQELPPDPPDPGDEPDE